MDCLGKLSYPQADAILCVYQLGYSYKEMALRADVPENTVRTRLHRGLRLLRHCLRSDGETEETTDETMGGGDPEGDQPNRTPDMKGDTHDGQG